MPSTSEVPKVLTRKWRRGKEREPFGGDKPTATGEPAAALATGDLSVNAPTLRLLSHGSI
jgi:hypothetical protein